MLVSEVLVLVVYGELVSEVLVLVLVVLVVHGELVDGVEVG